MRLGIPPETLAFVLAQEGGFVDNPRDPGGATMRGITQAVYDGYRDQHQQPRQSVQAITDDELRAIYEAQYWLAASCDVVEAGHPRLALISFDWAVNAGTGRARRYLQAVVGAAVDGLIGPKTAAALAACDESAAAAHYLILRAAHYHLRADDVRAELSADLLDQAGLTPVAPTPNTIMQEFLPIWMARLRACARATGIPIDPSYAANPT